MSSKWLNRLTEKEPFHLPRLSLKKLWRLSMLMESSSLGFWASPCCWTVADEGESLARVTELRNVWMERSNGFGMEMERHVEKGRVVWEFGGLGMGGSESE